MADELFVDQDEVEGTASGVWSRMLAGNRRFAEGKPEHPNRGAEAREALVDTHAPEAAILSCSDARVSPDIIFDAGIGDLFTVRTAGQVIDDAVIASLEYAVDVLGVRLLVVLGHQNCGAIKQASKEYEALLHELTADAEDSLMAADSIADIDERIMNAESLMMRTVGFSIWQAHESELESAEDFERVHIARTIEQLVERSEVIQHALAEQLGVSASAVGNYETGVSFPKEDVLLRLFDALEVDPNYLYRGSFRHIGGIQSDEERKLLEKYRRLPLSGRQTVHTLVDALDIMVAEEQRLRPRQERRTIPLYQSPAAAGFAAPVFGEDYTLVPVEGDVPPGAELAVRIQGDSMMPQIADGDVVYVNHDPLQNGDVGIFCVDGAMLCKQYHRDALGMTYLFSLNRARADADVVLTSTGTRSLACFGRVMLPHRLAVPQL